MQLISYLFNLGKCGIGLNSLFLQAFQFLLGFDDLPLEGIVFVLPQVAAFQLCFGLLLGQLQRIQFFLGGADGILEQLLLLGEQLVGSSFSSLDTSFRPDWVVLMDELTLFSALSSPVVSPPISTVMPLILLAKLRHLLKMA